MKKIVFIFVLLAATSILSRGQVIVISNQSIKSDSISKSDLRDVFTGAAWSLRDGSHVTPVLLKQGHTHEEFLAAYLNRSAVALLICWRGQVMSGQAVMPKTFDSEAIVVEYVAAHTGAIGYISNATPHEGVKVLTVR